MEDTLRHDLERQLHALCQPLSVLQCRLELGRMNGEYEALSQTVSHALVETAKIFRIVRTMQELLEQVDG